MTTRHISAFLLVCAALSLSAACSNDSESTAPETGAYSITVYGEEFIEDKIPAADTDGWEIKFEKFLIAVDQVKAKPASATGAALFDLTKPSNGEGHLLAEFAQAEAGAAAPLSYRIAPNTSFSAGNVTDEADKLAFISAGASIMVKGSASKDGVTKTFSWVFKTTTTYEDCQTVAKVQPGSTTASSQLTIHADHFFYDDLVSEEPNVAFSLVAQADADGDGEVTQAELEAQDITTQERYQVGNSTDVKNLWQFIQAQTKTLGHIDGEGHCNAM